MATKLSSSGGVAKQAADVDLQRCCHLAEGLEPRIHNPTLDPPSKFQFAHVENLGFLSQDLLAPASAPSELANSLS